MAGVEKKSQSDKGVPNWFHSPPEIFHEMTDS